MLKLEAHVSLIGLLELKQSFFEPNPKESMSSVWIPSHTRKLCLSMLANKYEGVTQGQQIENDQRIWWLLSCTDSKNDQTGSA